MSVDDKNTKINNTGHKTHEVKIYPVYYKAIVSGDKTWELRKNDRDYKVGDYILLREYDKGKYTGHKTIRRISYVYKGTGQFGLSEGYCILSLKKT